MTSLFATPISALTAGNRVAEAQSKTIAATGAVAGPGTFTYLVASTGGGVNSTTVVRLDGVGTPTAGEATNFAISGQGFAVVRNLPGNTADGQGTLGFTRIGTFKKDEAGNIVNGEGQFLQVFPLDPLTGLPASSDVASTANLVTLSANGLFQQATATQNISIKTQLAASTPTNKTFPQTVQVFDSLGVQHALTLTWTKIDVPTPGVQALPAATQYWKLTIATPDGTVAQGPDGADYTGTAGAGTGFIVAFDGQGKPVQWGYPYPGASPDPTPPVLDITWQGGAANVSAINLNLGTLGENNGITSLGSQSVIIAAPKIDGSAGGSFKSLSIAHDGTVSVTFTNDKTIKYARMPLALFNNPNGLSEISPGVFAVSGTSGDYQLSFPGVNGSGSLSTGMYEASPNDSTTAYIGLIETSRYFANNVKVIQVAQKMYDKLEQI